MCCAECKQPLVTTEGRGSYCLGCDYAPSMQDCEFRWLAAAQPSAEPAKVCSSADVVEAVREWQGMSNLAAEAAVSEMLRGSDDEHATGRGWILLHRLRAATIRTEAEVRRDERERCRTRLRELMDVAHCHEVVEAVGQCMDAIRAMGNNDEQA